MTVSVNQTEIYRVRKSWDNPASQKGAFKVLENAINLANISAGYKVFNSAGKIVYDPIKSDSHAGHVSILGGFDIDPCKLVNFVYNVNPNARDLDKITRAFIDIGAVYGIRGDIAFCQSILETGWFSFENTAVTPEQHNYCGLGVTSNGEKGHSFTTIEEGVTAQIQHLYAYATREVLPPGEVLVDPRFSYVSRGSAPHWQDLSMRWAMNENYGDHILSIYGDLIQS